jgi:hypothetical protein
MMLLGRGADPVVRFRNSPRGDVDKVEGGGEEGAGRRKEAHSLEKEKEEEEKKEQQARPLALVSHDVETLRAWRRLQQVKAHLHHMALPSQNLFSPLLALNINTLLYPIVLTYTLTHSHPRWCLKCSWPARPWAGHGT